MPWNYFHLQSHSFCFNGTIYFPISPLFVQPIFLGLCRIPQFRPPTWFQPAWVGLWRRRRQGPRSICVSEESQRCGWRLLVSNKIPTCLHQIFFFFKIYLIKVIKRMPLSLWLCLAEGPSLFQIWEILWRWDALSRHISSNVFAQLCL